MTTASLHRALRAALAACALAAISLSGCTSGAPAEPPPAAPDFSIALPSGGPIADESQPFIRGGESGLEVHTWMVADDSEIIGAALAPYVANPLPIDDALRDRWRAHGLRIVRVPLDEVAALRRSLPIVGRIDRNWLGQAPQWSEVMRGVGFTSRAYPVDGQPLPLGPGHLRLIARAWTSPTESAPLMRTELGVQHLPRAAASDAPDPFMAQRRVPLEDEGLVLSTLSARMALSRGDAFVITSERPSVDWRPARRSEDGAEPADGEAASNSDEDASFDDPAQGPPIGEPPAVGEGLLSRPGVGRDRALRVLIVLTPRLPETFHLLP